MQYIFAAETRLQFNMVKFANDNGLGNPVAGNYFRIQGE
jgi:hypothetical protein